VIAGALTTRSIHPSWLHVLTVEHLRCHIAFVPVVVFTVADRW
jgi:hypothetical protein